MKMMAHLEVSPPPIRSLRSEVPATLAAVLDRMLAKDQARRFATPGDVADALLPLAATANLAALVAPTDKAETQLPRDSAAPPAPDAAVPATKAGEEFLGQTPLPSRWHRMRRFGLPLAAVGLCVMLGVFATAWSGFRESPPPSGPLKILGMGIQQFRGENAGLIGDITATTEFVRTDDIVVVSVKLSRPAYCYLIAFNPDGTEQLCYPEDPNLAAVNYPDHEEIAQAMTTPPARTQEVRYPGDQGQYFEPSYAGLQAFVLIASSRPLPAYAQWRARVGQIPWGSVAYHQQWRWRFDGQGFGRLPSERGVRVERGVPGEFKELCDFVQTLPQTEAVQALAFPVTAQ
jgi:hypothetical protein